MGYLSCKAESSVVTCRSLSSAAASDPARTSASAPAAGTPRPGADPRAPPQPPRRVRVFSYSELEAATSNFSDRALLGRGSHGSVYRAVLRPSGRLVAVKRPSRLHRQHLGGADSSGRFPLVDRNEVENEIEILSQIHNPRLVNLVGISTYDDGTAAVVGAANGDSSSASPSPALGFCSSFSSASSSSFRRRERLLVVEYMPNGTLYDLLHSNSQPPGWGRRLRLALHIAKAIHALHSCDPPVIHRDVKSANVLIDGNFNARLGDFGLALRVESADGGDVDSSSSVAIRSTPPAGTLGYLDPGYITPENLSTKTDVFSFGILLLEMMSGRKAIDVAHSPPSVVEWAVPLLRKGKVLSLYDPRISPPKDPAARRDLASLAARCVRSSKDKRPSMEEVVVSLKLLCKTLPSKSWTTGLTVKNPCLMVDTADKSRSLKQHPTDTEECPNLSPVPSCISTVDEFEEAAGEEIPASSRKSPSSSKAVHPLWNTGNVISDRGPRGGNTSGINLMDLMMAPNEETLKVIGCCHQRSIISRARTMHLSCETTERDYMFHLRRNRSLREKGGTLLGLNEVKNRQE